MSGRSLTFLTFANGDIVKCEHPDDALTKIREISGEKERITMTQQSIPDGFSQTLEYDPLSDDWVAPSGKGVN